MFIKADIVVNKQNQVVLNIKYQKGHSFDLNVTDMYGDIWRVRSIVNPAIYDNPRLLELMGVANDRTAIKTYKYNFSAIVSANRIKSILTKLNDMEDEFEYKLY